MNRLRALTIILLEACLQRLRGEGHHEGAPTQGERPFHVTMAHTPSKPSSAVRIMGGRERLRRELHLAHCCPQHGCHRRWDGVTCPIGLGETPYMGPFNDCDKPHP